MQKKKEENRHTSSFFHAEGREWCRAENFVALNARPNNAYATLACVLSIFARSEPEDHIVGVAQNTGIRSHPNAGQIARHAFVRDDPNSVSRNEQSFGLLGT